MEDIENKEVKKGRAAFDEKYRGRYPDLPEDDEDAYYDKILGELGENETALSGYRENEKKIVEAFSKDPRNANLFLRIVNGEDVMSVLIDAYGEDFKVALDDPEKMEEMSAAQKKKMEDIVNSQKADEEFDDNLQKSLEVFESVSGEMGCSEDQMAEAW